MRRILFLALLAVSFVPAGTMRVNANSPQGSLPMPGGSHHGVFG
jgi:hypothetical protein